MHKHCTTLEDTWLTCHVLSSNACNVRFKQGSKRALQLTCPEVQPFSPKHMFECPAFTLTPLTTGDPLYPGRFGIGSPDCCHLRWNLVFL
ncbi:hypothetical protein TNCV_543921 [Trichonephila clavipes]|nr:hypothetical protein TNCV_543921 [Trichonephila clavipes]